MIPNMIVLVLVALIYVEYKNINRILYNIENKLYNNYPWPNLYELKINEDFITEKKNNLIFNKRLYSKKLLFDNNSDYILMCGDIEFPCIPNGKEVCLGSKKQKYGYLIYDQRNNDTCYNFMNNNILY